MQLPSSFAAWAAPSLTAKGWFCSSGSMLDSGPLTCVGEIVRAAADLFIWGLGILIRRDKSCHNLACAAADLFIWGLGIYIRYLVYIDDEIDYLDKE